MSTGPRKTETIDPKIKKWIQGEITSQLKELKQQLNRELIEDLDVIRVRITDDVTHDVVLRLQGEIERKSKIAVSRVAEDLRKEVDATVAARMDKVNNQLALTNDRQLAIVKQNTKELVNAVGQQVTNQVYSKVIGEINTKIVPRVNSMVEYVNYQMQDGGEVVTDYRRAVEAQANKHLQPGTKLLTDGKHDKQIISEHVRMFFSEEDSSDDDA